MTQRVRAQAVVYVGDLERMRGFYERCFGLTAAEAEDGYCGLESAAWRLMLVRSAEAVPAATPAARRANTPVKLGFAVGSIEALEPIVAGLGGRLDDAWEFSGATYCDCVDPEGNVVQLIQL